MTADVVALAAAVAALRERLDAAEKAIAGLEARAIEAERESARAWRTLDRLRAWRPCIACLHRGTPGCDACDDTGVAGVERVHVGERVIG